MRQRDRMLLFVVVFLTAVVWVSVAGREHAQPLRHFLRQLLRQLF